MSDLVGNPEDRFSQNEAHLLLHTQLKAEANEDYFHESNFSGISAVNFCGIMTERLINFGGDTSSIFSEFPVVF